MASMTLTQAIGFLGTLPALIRHEEEKALEAAAKVVQEEARAELGTYQPAEGPMPAWQHLAQSTQDARAKAGHSPDDPLLIEGELRDSIRTEIHGSSALVGSDLDKAVYQEIGTGRTPARPFLQRAAYVKRDEIMKRFMVAAGRAFRK